MVKKARFLVRGRPERMTISMKVAVINSGSSSIKYEVFDARDFTELATGLIEQIGSAVGRLKQRRLKDDGSFDEQVHTSFMANHREAFEFMAAVNREDRIISDDSELIGIGHRVVHGGEAFREPVMIDAGVLGAIRKLSPLAPLHNPSNILGIEAAQKRFPRVPQVAVFDTAFHQTLPPYAYRYAVPQELYEKYQVRKYGFHGSSHSYVTKEAARYLGKPLADLNLITLHLGNGASAAAIRGGRSVDTSLGMTPLEGLIMGTRCGDLDPSLPFYLMREAAMTAQEAEDLLNQKSGLKGICGVSDMREILDRAARGSEPAGLAIDMFCYRIKKYIGAYHAVLGRVDAIVFTGGVGENAAPIRQRACEGLQHIGISVDAGRNAGARGSVAEIHPDHSPVRVLVIRTNEEREIAQQVIGTIEKAKDRS
jgi:acetate kinase